MLSAALLAMRAYGKIAHPRQWPFIPPDKSGPEVQRDRRTSQSPAGCRGAGIESYRRPADWLTRLVGWPGESTLLPGLGLLDGPDERSSATTFSQYFFNLRRRLSSLPILLKTSAIAAKASVATGQVIASIAILPHPDCNFACLNRRANRIYAEASARSNGVL